MCVQGGVYQRKPRTVQISTTLDYGSGCPMLVSFLVFFPLACLVLHLVLIGISIEKDLSGDLPTLTTPPQNYKATIFSRVRSGCIKQTAFWAWLETEPDTLAYTKQNQTLPTFRHRFWGASHGSIGKNIPAWRLVLGVRAETQRQNRRQHRNAAEKLIIVFATIKAAESLDVLDLLLINSVLEADYLIADNVVSASLHLMQK